MSGRDERGRFSADLSAHERAFFDGIQARDLLRRALNAPFGRDGKPIGVTAEESAWAVKVVRERPEWAEAVMRELGFPPRAS